ncbi:MAG: hypothetical protein IT447_15785 [Phycisphaerales bacterium]|jgi:hypothetical protein|nr:hypothetical protein [Phycisphaerales bacterium]
MIPISRSGVCKAIGAFLIFAISGWAWAEQPTPEPVRKGTSNIFGNNNEDEPDQNQEQAGDFPDFLRPGVRLTYFEGSSVVQGVNSQVVPDDKGNLVDPQTGKHYRQDDMKNSGGVGYAQINVVTVDPELVAADARSFQIIDLNNNTCSATSVAALTGNADQLGMYWINPARLANMEPHADRNERVNRIQYTLNDRNYDAISMVSVSEAGYTSRIYDLKTGLLLSSSSSETGGNVNTLDKNNTITPGRGSSYISHSRFVSIRQVDIPWAQMRMPRWVSKVRQIDYQGGYTAILQGGALPGYAMAVSFSIGQVSHGCAQARMMTRSDIGNGLPPQESTVDRCFGSAMLAGLWVPPEALQQLNENQLIDKDPITRFRTTFTGIQGQSAIFVEQGPSEITQTAYDVQSGVLQGIQTRRKTAAGEMQVQLQLAGQQ